MTAALPKFRARGLLAAGLICVFALAAVAFAAPNAKDSGANQPGAKELAQRVDRHYNNLRSLKAGFTENYQGLGAERTESGTLLLLKPGRMRWDYTSPPGKMFLLDSKYAWSYTKGNAQAERIPAKDLNDLRSPMQYLLGHAQLAKELKGLKGCARGRWAIHAHGCSQGHGKPRFASHADRDRGWRDPRYDDC